MKVQPIASFEQRTQRYSQQLRVFWFLEMPVIFVVSSIACLVISYGITEFLGVSLWMDWRLSGAAMAIISMIPPLFIGKPVHPVLRDVEIDQTLRRTFGLDDTIAK